MELDKEHLAWLRTQALVIYQGTDSRIGPKGKLIGPGDTFLYDKKAARNLGDCYEPREGYFVTVFWGGETLREVGLPVLRHGSRRSFAVDETALDSLALESDARLVNFTTSPLPDHE